MFICLNILNDWLLILNLSLDHRKGHLNVKTEKMSVHNEISNNSLCISIVNRVQNLCDVYFFGYS